jgi:poly(hydroxyalkanoate) depolymerase family esterase
MNLKIPAALMDATRLVRQGQLTEATHAIQRALRGYAEASSDAAPDPQPELREHDAVIDGDFRVIDIEPPPQKPGRFKTGSYTNAAGTREYKLYVPAAHHPRALPVLVMLHGCKQGPDDFAAGTRMNALAEEYGLIVVYPRQAAKANNSKCWNWFESKHQARDVGEPSLIAGITREVLAAYGADRERVYIAGLSAGGAMAAVMAATYPDVYAAVGIHSGLAYAAAHDVPSAFEAMRGSRRAKRKSRGDRRAHMVPTIVFHGDSDQTVHPSNGEQVIAHASSATATGEAAGHEASKHERSVEHGHASGRAYTRTTYRNDRGEPVIEQWLVHGGAHAWSGGSTEGSFSDPAGPDASREMVRFFLLHKK